MAYARSNRDQAALDFLTEVSGISYKFLDGKSGATAADATGMQHALQPFVPCYAAGSECPSHFVLPGTVGPMDKAVVKTRKGLLDEDAVLDDATRLVIRGTIRFTGIEDETLRFVLSRASVYLSLRASEVLCTIPPFLIPCIGHVLRIRKWMDTLCPSMKVLNRKTLREYVAMAYTEVVAIMKNAIDSADGVSPGTGEWSLLILAGWMALFQQRSTCVMLFVDGWRDKRGWELEGVNVAIVCKDMVVRNLVIDLDQIPVKHRDGAAKAKHIAGVLSRYVGLQLASQPLPRLQAAF